MKWIEEGPPAETKQVRVPKRRVEKGSVYQSGDPYHAGHIWTPQGANETGATVYWSTPTTGSGSTYASASSILNPAIQNK